MCGQALTPGSPDGLATPLELGTRSKSALALEVSVSRHHWPIELGIHEMKMT
jgi:hypothetical protein